jgi:eukaryotic-like serine/threonine-protein kinase
MNVLLPDQLGPYRIGRMLGRGGMGIVYEGVNVETDEKAAVKVLSAALAAEGDFRQRFEGEIEALRKLYHPNIVQLYGFGEQDDVLFYAMELVDGSSLEDELRAGRRFDWREVAQIGIDTCRGLRHAHDRGVIHRDIKPANLLLTRDGRIKLSDFGIARLFGNVRVTTVGNIVGTVEFMAPEQAGGRGITPRGDLYSLGAVFYTLFARRPPFPARSIAEMLSPNRPAKPEPLERVAPDVPEQFLDIIEQLLDRDPEKRIANATVLARQLQSMVLARSPEAATESAPPEALEELPAKPRDIPDLAETWLQTAPRDGAVAAAPAEDRPASPVAPPAAPSAEPGATKPPTPARRFVAVAEADRQWHEPATDSRSAIISIQTWVLAASLVAVGLGAWYFLQPPTAETLYRRVSTAAGAKDPGALVDVEASIREFIARFPNDPRVTELQEYETRIEIDRLERKLEQRARGMLDLGDASPTERAYVEAVHSAWSNREQGIAKLDAIIALYPERTETTSRVGQCLVLARRQVQRLKTQLAKSAATSQAELEERLGEAQRQSPANPAAARAIYRALIEIYHDKPWATDIVVRARKALNDTPATGSGQPVTTKK